MHLYSVTQKLLIFLVDAIAKNTTKVMEIKNNMLVKLNTIKEAPNIGRYLYRLTQMDLEELSF